MTYMKKLDKIYKSANQINIDDKSKIILMSDCHRGDGSWADDFARNQHLYFAALNYYYDNNFTYIELGDGDELWENKSMEPIKKNHSDVFWMLSRFYKEKRFYSIYGNHDIVKSREKFNRKQLSTYLDEPSDTQVPLFPNIKIPEALILNYRPTGRKIFLVHGNQVDPINSTFWPISRFLVRYFWRSVELFGIKNPTRTGENNEKREKIERKLIRWVKKNNIMMVAGHTHRPVFPRKGQPLYFNDGCGIHPRCITGIEICDGEMMLIKWYVATKPDGTMYVSRKVLAGPRRLAEL
ncbi:MAG TPA: serine/threonine protein phosphatase [Clostridiales bacterium]|nr:serine/threonine protein phosphatase [Clostridiales bacterium]